MVSLKSEIKILSIKKMCVIQKDLKPENVEILTIFGSLLLGVIVVCFQVFDISPYSQILL